MYVLLVSLYKDPFEVMITGEKDREYREASKWILSRLEPKGKPRAVDFIKCINGYGYKKPYFVAKVLYFRRAKKNYKVQYSNGFTVFVKKGDFIIRLGAIIEKGEQDNFQFKIFPKQ